MHLIIQKLLKKSPGRRLVKHHLRESSKRFWQIILLVTLFCIFIIKLNWGGSIGFLTARDLDRKHSANFKNANKLNKYGVRNDGTVFAKKVYEIIKIFCNELQGSCNDVHNIHRPPMPKKIDRKETSGGKIANREILSLRMLRYRIWQSYVFYDVMFRCRWSQNNKVVTEKADT